MNHGKKDNKNQQYDLIVIGTGSAGSTVAYRCRSAGWKVAIIDSRPFGGTCALRGCDPKKVLVGASELVDWHNRMRNNGVISREVKIDWPALMRFKQTFTNPVPQKREEAFIKAGIDTFHGSASFVGKDSIEINSQVLKGRYIVIATGAKPAKLGITGEEYLITSDQFLELKRLPRKIIFVGGGYIAFELAHIVARAGVNTQILHRGVRPLVGFDPDLVNKLVEATKDINIDVQLNTEVKAIEKFSKDFVVHVSSGNKQKKFRADMVVHAAGRIPDIDNLNLEKANIKSDPKRGIMVNEHLQSVSNPIIYAAGDASAGEGLPLTPIAGVEGQVVAHNLLSRNKVIPDYSATSTVVFTTPALASVGISEEEARKKGLKFKISQGDTSWWYSSRRIGLKYSGFKIIIDQMTNQVLGAHLLGHNPEEIINIFAIAIRFGLKSSDLKKIIYAYPTSASDIPYML